LVAQLKRAKATCKAFLGDQLGKPAESSTANARAAFAALDWELDLYCAQAENDCASSSEDDRDSRLASVLGGSGGGTG